MARKRFSVEQIINHLREADIMLAQGRMAIEVCRHIGISEQTYYRWRRENGYNESFNGKLRDELLNTEIFYTLKEAKVLIERWRNHYNTVRPHSSLGYKPPAPRTWIEGRPDQADATYGLWPNRAFPTETNLT